MPPAPRRIVFHTPSLVTDDAGPRRDRRIGAAGLEPATGRTTSRPAEAEPDAEDRDVRKLATLLEVGQALAGNLSLQTGL